MYIFYLSIYLYLSIYPSIYLSVQGPCPVGPGLQEGAEPGHQLHQLGLRPGWSNQGSKHKPAIYQYMYIYQYHISLSLYVYFFLSLALSHSV